MDYFLFPQMTDEEKSYCAEILSKYKSQPRIDFVIPELVEWWNPDKAKMYYLTDKLIKAKKAEYQTLLRTELEEDPFALAHWMIPYLFRVCWKHKVPCQHFYIQYDNKNGIFETGIYGSKSENWIRSRFGLPALTEPDPEYFPGCVFNEEFYKTVQVRTTDGTTVNVIELIREQPNKDELPVASYRAKANEFWSTLYSDVNKMLHAVATKTPYKSVSSDISERYFQEYFPRIKTLGKRVCTAYVENEFTRSSFDLDTEDVLGILYAVYKSCIVQSQQEPRRKAPHPTLGTTHPLSLQKFNKYLALLTSDQLVELLEFFDVSVDQVTPKGDLIALVQTIFKDVSLEDSPNEIDELWTKILEQFVLTRETTSNLFEMQKERVQAEIATNPIRSFDSEKASAFYYTLYTNLSSFFTACSAISSGKVSHKRETGVKILGSVMDLVKLGWLVRAFDDYRKTERAKVVMSQLKNPAHLVADEIANKLVHKYATQIERIDLDKIEVFSEHTFERMVKHIEKNRPDTLSLVDKFVRSVYMIELKNGFVTANKLNSDNWTADGVYLGTSMRTPDGVLHLSKRRGDDKYGVIEVEQGEEKMRVV
jgi:hypothetical protein